MKLSTAFLIFCFLTQASFAASLKVKSGGFLIKAAEHRYYSHAIQETEVVYENAVIGDDASIEIGIKEAVRDATESGKDEPTLLSEFKALRYPMKRVSDGKWKATIPTFRHGLGGLRKVNGLKVIFWVTYPGKKAASIGCTHIEENDGYFEIYFPNISDLAWRKTAQEPFKMVVPDVQCWDFG